jgi:methionyl-tRNA formyltransferase
VKILFAGSATIAVPSLEALDRLCREDGAFRLVGLLTNADSRRGRGSETTPTDVAAAAGRLKSSAVLFKPDKLDGALREAVAALEPDLLASFAYGRIFGPRFLSLFPLGGVNVHPSLLPRHRGATPIPAAILGRDRETGVSVQRLALQMDAGDILAQERIPLNGRETTLSLSGMAAEKGAAMLVATLRDIELGRAVGKPQNEGGATYCSVIGRDDGLIDWSQGAAELDAKIRAYNPWPLCRTAHRGAALYILEASPYAGVAEGSRAAPGTVAPGTALGIDRDSGILVQTGNGVLAVTRLQYAAKKALPWRDFLNGAGDFVGSRLGAEGKRVT